MWPDQKDTVELLEQAKKGDRRSVDQLMDRHRDALRQLIHMRLDKQIQQRVDASDVIQDVLVEATRRLQNYLANPVMSFRLWLRQIAQDRIIDAHRRHRVSARRSVNREHAIGLPKGADRSSVQLASLLRDGQLTPAATALQKEMANNVKQAISKLEPMDSEIIIMRHYERLTNQEVAGALNLSEPAASMRYLRALRRMKVVLQDTLSSMGQE